MSGERVAVDLASIWPDDQADVDEGVVANWFERAGASVDEGDTLCEIQIEKVSIDVPAPVTGTLDEVGLEADAEFSQDDTLAWIRPAEADG
jgi:pyruvate/2-oxoglutarate dehydrogenase complex dihydrolipoamide acyltransferase (E2) component